MPAALPRCDTSVVSGREVMEPVLTAVGVSKRFAGVTALDEVALNLHPGEVHALVGENGAGKSTLIKVLTGVYAPDEGEITYLGESISLSSPRAAWDIGISTTFQEITLVPMMSVARNLYLGNEPRSRWRLLDVGEMNRNATALLRRYGIDIDVRRPVNSFGAGVQQMIAIVRAVSTDARVVILDEPTSSLEPREVAQVFGMIRRLRGAGVALLFVSHNLDEVFEISDRITILRDGRRRPDQPDHRHDQARGDRHDARSGRRRGSLGRAHQLHSRPAGARRGAARRRRAHPTAPAARRVARPCGPARCSAWPACSARDARRR